MSFSFVFSRDLDGKAFKGMTERPKKENQALTVRWVSVSCARLHLPLLSHAFTSWKRLPTSIISYIQHILHQYSFLSGMLFHFLLFLLSNGCSFPCHYTPFLLCPGLSRKYYPRKGVLLRIKAL